MLPDIKSERQIHCKDLSQLDQTAKGIVNFALGVKVWLIKGNLGSGKTSLIKAVGKQFHIEDNINSPTFNIINEYLDQNNQIYYHFDFYRLKEVKELIDIGVEEYLYSGNYCFIEWPALAKSLLPESFVMISIQVNDDQSREFHLIKNDG